MPIEALPQATLRAIGSSSVISDPCSVVKELIDNALDASASSLAIEISSNTIDVIQLKDNGHGIPVDDHPFVCQHAFTSKIQTTNDLKNVGGTSLGFRGEALASVAEMSGGIAITTRVSTDVTGSCIKYTREGKVLQTQRTAAPVGTTVKISDFLKYIPVRRQTILKGAAKTLIKIKKLLQAYAFAQPSIRFSLKVLKAKNENNNWMYVPSPDAAISDASVKIIGRDASSCCTVKSVSSDLGTQDESGSNQVCYNLEAFLPGWDIDFSKVNNIGQFVSLDGRPLASSRGIAQAITKLYKSCIRLAASKTQPSVSITDPFLCIQLKCPRGVYDVNIEPSKDDVIFEDRNAIMSLVETLFRDHYGQLPRDAKANAVKGKAASPAKKGENGSEFNVLMARERHENDVPTQPTDMGEILGDLTIPPSHSHAKSPARSAISVPPSGDDRTEDQGDQSSTSSNTQQSRFLNPWSITQMNTPFQTPRRDPGSRPSVSPDFQRETQEPSRPISKSGRSPQSPPESPELVSSVAGMSSRSPKSRRPRNTQASHAESAAGRVTASEKRAAREQDRERYGNGALDTWFQRTTQTSMGHTPLDQLREIDEIVPTLPHISRKRFGAAPADTQNENGTCEKSKEISSGTSNGSDSSAPSPGEPTSAINVQEGSMDSGRGFPVLEHWAASLKEGFNAKSSGLEWAMDFEQRKKEANEKFRARPAVYSQVSSQPQSTQFSKTPHQNRFIAAKAALAAERPFTVEELHGTGLSPHDPRAYLMRRKRDNRSNDQRQGTSKLRRIHLGRLPFERIPDGCDLHNVSLPVTADMSSILTTCRLMSPLDSYIKYGQEAGAFEGSGIDNLAQDLNQKLQLIIDTHYKRAPGTRSIGQIDMSTVIAECLKHHQK
ncbi:hypothetical protein N7532_009990 [Penicillium argentinense]|uniref:DNA mismatch repair protein S5 domain-containing protein n=1 Tax=Penicillium argentinense TaxID=1131581 RepID=A0A9W9ENZ1_9EURO|nr:uncharacterized protein N7532_009990 [Penicillium argentinense]KAJ5085219.1 hypothetical protein N7532_009990 [Penicillium argentinense]